MSVTIAMPRMSTDPELTTAQSKYVESLARAGAEVHWVALSDPDAAAAEALTCDGLLLPGGGDMDPAFYGQERIPACGEPNLLRDAAEPKLLRAFLAADMPVLGICRGIQVMNVVLGGTLYQDIKPFEHVPHNDHWAKVHTVTVRRGTLLSRLLGQDTVLVNSQHHQAAGDVKYVDQPDVNGNYDGQIDSDDRVAIGHPTIPEIIYGFGPSITWKKWHHSKKR
jgi:putative glutamine amidotransferase